MAIILGTNPDGKAKNRVVRIYRDTTGHEIPNKHHFHDLAPFGIDNNNGVFNADDRPCGLIQATVTRDAPDAGPAWRSYTGLA